MNIFILDKNLEKNSQYHVDRHIVKMPLELAQMICTTYHVLGYNNLPDFIFKKSTYINHPCSKWIRESQTNFTYGCLLGLALYDEYQYRYNKPDKMQRVKKIFEYALKNKPKIKDKKLTNHAKALPEKYKKFDSLKAYRLYYKYDKKHLHKWTKRNRPKFINAI